MGRLPEARLKPAPPFTYTMVDLFGPYVVRGEVQKRASGKACGVIFTDLVSRAVQKQFMATIHAPFSWRLADLQVSADGLNTSIVIQVLN